MHFFEQAHAYHRIWRYRLRTERSEIAHFLSRDWHGASVVDVGAHRGAYSYWMHKAVGSQGHVIAFEPQPELAAYLRELKSAFRLTRLCIVEAALSSSAGQRQLVRPKHWGAASLQLAPNAQSDVLPIAALTMDEYFRASSLRPLRFIKADIQGHEYDCFVGGERILQEDRPEILCELRDTEFPQVRTYLQSLNYAGFFFYKRKLTPIAQWPRLRSAIAAPYLNYIFIPAERAATSSAAVA